MRDQRPRCEVLGGEIRLLANVKILAVHRPLFGRPYAEIEFEGERFRVRARDVLALNLTMHIEPT
jgi:hypothetical protein